MLKFASPFYIWGLCLIPFLTAAYIYWTYKRQKDLNKLGDPEVISKLTRNTNYFKRHFKFSMVLFSIFILTVTAMRPQWGTKMLPMKRKGIDIIFMLDISKSMLTEDIKPNRLEKAKGEISTFVQKLKGDRIGLVVFAGSAFVSCPLTLDYNALQMFIDIVNPNMIQRQGTEIGFALKTTIPSFNQRERKHKAIILLTDGEDHGNDALEIAKAAKNEGIRIYTIGIGTSQGEPIPIKDKNDQITGYVKDRSGTLILSKLDEKMLLQIASLTGGKYVHAQYGNLELEKIYQHIQSLEKKELESKKIKQYEDRFQIFLLLAIIFLIIEMLISDKNYIQPLRESRYD